MLDEMEQIQVDTELVAVVVQELRALMVQQVELVVRVVQVHF